jgi:hypothetical protein
MLLSERAKVSDEFNQTQIWLPPSPIVGSLISATRDTEPFKPFAGLRRGTFTSLGLKQNYTKTEMDTMLGIQINPLTVLAGAYVLLDTLTAQTFKSVLSDMNIRFLFDYINEVSSDYLYTYIHEYNNTETRETIEDGLQRVLDNLVNQGDLLEGLVQCNDSNNPPVIIDSGELVVDQYLKPIRAAKQIHNRLIGLPTGVDISELV